MAAGISSGRRRGGMACGCRRRRSEGAVLSNKLVRFLGPVWLSFVKV
jgi:hypothetical protein